MRRLGIVALADEGNGGTFQYTLSMLEAARALRDWDVTLYTTAPLEPVYRRLSLTTRLIPAKRAGDAPLLARARLGLRAREPFPDVDLVLSPIKSALLLHTSRPFLFTLHDLQERYLPEFSSRARRVYLDAMYSSLLRRAAGVICESTHVATDITTFYGYDPERIHVIPAPPVRLAAQFDDSTLRATRDKFCLPDVFLFYPARFWAHKNHRRLVQAFALIADRFPAAGLVFTGRKQEEYERIARQVAESGLEGRVITTGYIDQQELACLYRLATAVVVPTLFESVSIPVYEAQQAARAVAVSGILAMPEQVGDTGLLFDPLSVEAMAEAMATLLADPVRRHELAQAGARRVGRMTVENYSLALEGALDRALIRTEPGHESRQLPR